MAPRLNVKLAVALSLAFVCLVEAQAQSGRLRDQTTRPRLEGDKNGAQDDRPLRLRVEEVLLPVSVRNQLGRLPVDLKATDFIVAEDGNRRDVNAVMRTPANLLFVIDANAESTLKNINTNRELVLKMIEALGAEDRAAIITYSDRVDLLSGWTGDKKQLRDALNWKYKPGLQSDLYSALIYAADEVLAKVSGRRSIVLVSDGVDSYEKPVAEGVTLMFEKALASLHRARATIYVAGQNEMVMSEIKPLAFNPLSWYERLDPQQRKRVDRLRRYYRQLEAGIISLRGLAEETGGVMWTPATREQFLKLNAKIVEEIGTECVIAYSSERAPDDDGFHAVKVYGTRPDIMIRFRRGIYSSLAIKTAAIFGDARLFASL